MSKSLKLYEGSSNTNSWIILGIIVFGIIYLLRTRHAIGYQNAETWEIIRNEQGFATKLIVHRNATEG